MLDQSGRPGRVRRTRRSSTSSARRLLAGLAAARSSSCRTRRYAGYYALRAGTPQWLSGRTDAAADRRGLSEVWHEGLAGAELGGAGGKCRRWPRSSTRCRSRPGAGAGIGAARIPRRDHVPRRLQVRRTRRSPRASSWRRGRRGRPGVTGVEAATGSWRRDRRRLAKRPLTMMKRGPQRCPPRPGLRRRRGGRLFIRTQTGWFGTATAGPAGSRRRPAGGTRPRARRRGRSGWARRPGPWVIGVTAGGRRGGRALARTVLMSTGKPGIRRGGQGGKRGTRRRRGLRTGRRRHVRASPTRHRVEGRILTSGFGRRQDPVGRAEPALVKNYSIVGLPGPATRARTPSGQGTATPS